MEFTDDNKLKYVGVETEDASWAKTAEYAVKLKNISTELYGKPKVLKIISEENFEKLKDINQTYAEWPVKNSLYVHSLAYKQSGGYSVGFFYITGVTESKASTNDNLTKAGKRIQAKHPDWDDDTCNIIGSGKINIGMTKEQVRAAWGRPYKVNKTTNAYGTSEQWVMHELGGSYVYFEDGTCTTIQN